MSELTPCRVGDSWTGRGDHLGHTITAIEWWPTRIDPTPDWEGLITSGRVRCTCGIEWDTCVWPPDRVHLKAEAGKALCEVLDAEGFGSAGPGDLLSTDEAEVTCHDCIEWRHA